MPIASRLKQKPSIVAPHDWAGWASQASPAGIAAPFAQRAFVRSFGRFFSGKPSQKPPSLTHSLVRSFGRFFSGKPSQKPPSLTHRSLVACIFCSGKPSPKNAGSRLAPASLSPPLCQPGWLGLPILPNLSPFVLPHCHLLLCPH